MATNDNNFEMWRENKPISSRLSQPEPNNREPNSPNTNQIYPGMRPEYKSSREYAECLRNWIYQYRLWTAFASFQSTLMASMPPPTHHNFNLNGFAPQNIQPGTGRQENVVLNPTSNTNDHRNQYRIPSLWKRVAAEFLDFILLFYTKLLVTFAFLQQTGYVHEHLFELDTQIPFFYDITEMDYDKMFTLTSELIALEVINRTCITIVETLCIQRGYAGSIGGATPGKKIMQLRVVFYEGINDIGNGQISIEGARDPGLINAFLRSMIKNFSMAFFFPACFTVFLFRFNRAAYDVLTHTIVVEIDRPAQQQQ